MLQTDIDFIALHLANAGRQYHARPVVASLDHPEVAMMKSYWQALGYDALIAVSHLRFVKIPPTAKAGDVK